MSAMSSVACKASPTWIRYSPSGYSSCSTEPTTAIASKPNHTRNPSRSASLGVVAPDGTEGGPEQGNDEVRATRPTICQGCGVTSAVLGSMQRSLSQACPLLSAGRFIRALLRFACDHGTSADGHDFVVPESRPLTLGILVRPPTGR